MSWISKAMGSGIKALDPLDIFGGAGRDYNSAQAAATRQFNAEEAQKQRDWEERMSNTSHQRAAADLEAAGLNRTLAATEGATTPGAAAASGPSAADGGNNSTGILGALASYIQLQQQQKLITAQSNLMDSEAALNKVRAGNETDINPGENQTLKLIDGLIEKIPEMADKITAQINSAGSKRLKKESIARKLFDGLAKLRGNAEAEINKNLERQNKERLQRQPKLSAGESKKMTNRAAYRRTFRR